MSNHFNTISFLPRWGLILGVSACCSFTYANEESLENIDYLVGEILKEDATTNEEELFVRGCEVADDNFLVASVAETPTQNAEMAEEPSRTMQLYNSCCPVSEPAACQSSRWSRICDCVSFEPCTPGSTSHQLFPYIRANAGRGIGFDCDYTTIGAMYSTLGCGGRVQPFLDFKWHNFTDRRNAANAGIGVRYLSRDCNVVYGFNAYYDYRDGCFSNFHQVGVGMEVLSRCFEFHVNGYYPFRCDGCRHPKIFDDYIGDFFVSCQRCDFTMRGADAEAGFVLFRCCGFRTLIGAGAYYFNDNFDHHALGARGRLNIRFRNHVGFDLYATTDKVFRNRVQGQFYISLPFTSFCQSRCEKTNCSPLCCFASQPVYRNDMIVLRQGCCWDFNFDDQIGRENKKSKCGGCGCGCGCH